MAIRSTNPLLFGVGLSILAVVFSCSSTQRSETGSVERVGAIESAVVVTPANHEKARNRSGAAFFNGRTYVGWVGTDGDHQINVASAPACPPDTWNVDYQKPPPFSNEHGSDDDKAGLSMAASPDGMRLFLVYTGRSNNVYLKWMFIDQAADGGHFDHWSDPISLPGSGSEDDAPSIAVNQDSIYVGFTDTNNQIYVGRADMPKTPPQASDTFAFDPPVALPHDGNVHRSDNGPSLTFYKSSLLLSYITQTQCTEGCGAGTCQRCRHLVINFMDTTNPTTLAKPVAVEFSRIFSDEKEKSDFEFAPAILGLPDGVVVAFRQDRHDGPLSCNDVLGIGIGDNCDHDIHVKKFSDDEMAGLLASAQQQGPGNVYGDFPNERGVSFRDGVKKTDQSTPNDPNLAALATCNGTTPDPSQRAPALVWRGEDEALNVQSNIVPPSCNAPFKYSEMAVVTPGFDDTTDHTPAYANALFDKRKKAVVEDFACKEPLFDSSGNPVGGSSSVLARLALSSVHPEWGAPGMDHCPRNPNSATQEAENWINKQSCSNRDLGTNGEWDVPSSDFIRMFYQWPDANTDSSVKTRLLALVDGSSQNCSFRENPVGPIHNGDETVQSVAGDLVRETENHLLFIESNRYLYNQTKNPSDNTTVNDDFTVQKWLQQRLQAILQGYFYEYNSAAAYEKYSAQAVSNLFEYSKDLSIKTSARMVLDLLSAHEALATKDLRRMEPFRRHPLDWNPYLLLPDPQEGAQAGAWGHPERDRYQILSGESRMLKNACPDESNLNLVGTVLGKYRMPDPILDRLLNRSHQRGFGRLHLTNRGSRVMHSNSTSNRTDGWEVFFQDPDFLISAGGIATRNQYDSDCGFSGLFCAAQNENGQDVWTTLMPTGTITNSGLALHIEQPRELNTNAEYNLDDNSIPNWRKTCVGPNFACGRDVVIPTGLCKDKKGPFTFVDFTKNCTGGLTPAPAEQGHGFYAAVFQSTSDDFGFFEVEGVKTVGATITNLQQFEQAVLALNGSGSFGSGNINTYTTLQGDTLTFSPISRFDQWNLTGLTRNCDKAVNPAACRAAVLPVVDGTAPSNDTWLAEGDFMTNTDLATGTRNSTRRWIRNPFTCQQLITDYADATNPFYVDPLNTANRLCDPGAGQCQAPCTATPTGACSCPSTQACMPPGDVTAPLPPDGCLGQYVQFPIDATVCPSQIALWSPTSTYGNPSSTFTTVSGGSAVVVLNGKSSGTPSVGFQIDYPTLPATIPSGCHPPTSNAPNGAPCDAVNGTLDLPPGRYGSIVVNTSGTLVLHAGDYMFDSLMLNSASTLILPAGQRVRIITVVGATLHPQVLCASASGTVACNGDSVASNFGIMDLGTSDVFIEGSLAGTVVAPNAKIRIQAENGHPVYGSFWSKKGVVVEPPGTIVVPSNNVFFDANDAPAYPGCSALGADGGVADAAADTSVSGPDATSSQDAAADPCTDPVTLTTSQSVQALSRGGTCFVVSSTLRGTHGVIANFAFPQGVNTGSYSVKSFRAASDNATQCQVTTNAVTNNQLSNVPIGPSTGGATYITVTPNDASTTSVSIAVGQWTNGSGCSTIGPIP